MKISVEFGCFLVYPVISATNINLVITLNNSLPTQYGAHFVGNIQTQILQLCLTP